MIYVHMTPVVSHIRVYAESDGYKNRKRYQAILTVQHNSEMEVTLIGASGMADRETWNKVLGFLYEQGVRTAQIERRGEKRTLILEPPAPE